MFFSDDMRDLVVLFQKHGVEFAVCGGFAVAHYGFMRMTMDLDLLVLPSPENADRIVQALEEFGFGEAGFTAENFIEPGSAITLGEQPNQIDLLTSMSSQPTAEILEHANVIEIEGHKMNVVSYSDLLVAKRQAGRSKDLIDVEELERIQQSGDAI